MQYISTRQTGTEGKSFEDILLAGLAPDGGLYVPEEFPSISTSEIAVWGKLDYVQLTTAVLSRFMGSFLPEAELLALVADAYTGFDHAAIAPLKQIGRDQWILELFHGPTLAFKDYALQILGRLFDTVLAKRSERITIVGATSGDTGSAAIEACRDRANLDIFILYPQGRTSAVQRRQMTTVDAPNVYTISVDGSFDTCQDLVKALFADEEFRRDYGLSAVNSINWARIAAQIAYYFVAATALGAPGRKVSFAVPTGNFGNVYAGHVARLMGLPIEQLIIGTNRNDILYRFIESGEMRITSVEPSFSPSMDIQVSSNFERLFFELLARDGGAVTSAMSAFRQTGLLPADRATWQKTRSEFLAHRLDDAGIETTIRNVYRKTGEMLDPHSAVAVSAMFESQRDPGTLCVALACAHPAKFPEVVERATGHKPVLPPHLADLMDRPERINTLPNDYASIRHFISSRARRRDGS